MIRSLWTAATGMQAQPLNIDVISNNLANVSTSGYKKSRADFQDLSIVKELDMSSPLINKACWSGQHIDQVTLRLNRAGGKERQKYMEYIMENVIISSVSVGGGGGIPTESVTFNYGRITTTYTKQARKGGGGAGEVPAAWDLEANDHGKPAPSPS